MLETSTLYDKTQVRFVCNEKYATASKRQIKTTVKGDRIVDSVRYPIIGGFTKDNTSLLNMILSPDIYQC